MGGLVLELVLELVLAYCDSFLVLVVEGGWTWNEAGLDWDGLDCWIGLIRWIP